MPSDRLRRAGSARSEGEDAEKTLITLKKRMRLGAGTRPSIRGVWNEVNLLSTSSGNMSEGLLSIGGRSAL